MTSTTMTAAVVLLIVLSLIGNTMSSTSVTSIKQPSVPSLLQLGSASATVSSPGFRYAVSLASSYAATTLSANHYLSQRTVPSVIVSVVKLAECEEEFDQTIREAKFAFRSTDLAIWNSLPPSSAGENKTDTDRKNIQHWALVVHFPRGNKTYMFEAWKDESNGLLQPGRAEGVDYQVFTNATYFGKIETSPSQLLAKAKQVSTGNYDVLVNNCQTWLKNFVRLVSPELLLTLYDKVPETNRVHETETLPKNDTYLSSIEKYMSSIGRVFLGLLL